MPRDLSRGLATPPDNQLGALSPGAMNNHAAYQGLQQTTHGAKAPEVVSKGYHHPRDKSRGKASADRQACSIFDNNIVCT